MQTVSRVDGRIGTGNRVGLWTVIGANLLVAGALGALAVLALVVLTSDPGGPLPSAPSAVAITPAPDVTTTADEDRSWLCDAVSDDSPPESRVAVAEALGRQGITCALGQPEGSRPPAAE